MLELTYRIRCDKCTCKFYSLDQDKEEFVSKLQAVCAAIAQGWHITNKRHVCRDCHLEVFDVKRIKLAEKLEKEEKSTRKTVLDSRRKKG